MRIEVERKRADMQSQVALSEEEAVRYDATHRQENEHEYSEEEEEEEE